MFRDCHNPYWVCLVLGAVIIRSMRVFLETRALARWYSSALPLPLAVCVVDDSYSGGAHSNDKTGCFNPAENSRPGEKRGGSGDGEIQSPSQGPRKQGRGDGQGRYLLGRQLAHPLFARRYRYNIFTERRREKAKKEPSCGLNSALAGSPSWLPLPFAIIFFSFLPLYTAASSAV